MESERSRTSGADQERAACVGCGEPVSGARCEHCGISVAPGGWVIERLLAKGPHSRVFLAKKDGRKVALKELLFALVPDSTQLEGFEREARLLKQLNHPAIPKLVESFREGSGVHTRLYLAQDFVPGASLLQELDGHRFSEPEVKSIARALLETLEYLHGLSPRVIHRDIKPANIMRREDGSLALVDFGAARDLVRGQTHGSTLVGTFGYMPPEQLGGTVDLSSDLYALGASLVHLLSRRAPDEFFKPGMELSFDDDVNVSPGLLTWLKKMVARTPGERFRTAKSAREALDLVGQAAPRLAQPQQTPTSGRALAIAVVAGVVLLAGLAVGWVTTTKPVSSGPPGAMVVSVPKTPAPPQPQAFERIDEAPVRVLPPEAPPVAAPAVVKQPHGRVSMAPEAVRPQQPVLVPVPKVAPLAPFTVTKTQMIQFEHSAPVTSAACPAGTAKLNINGLKVSPGKLAVWTQLENGDTEPGCTSVYLELLDQRGARDPARATLLKSARGNTAALRETELTLPENSQRVQLRFGPQAKPLAVIDVDLAKGTATAR